MKTLREGYDGLSLVLVLNLDRLGFFVTIMLALIAVHRLGGL